MSHDYSTYRIEKANKFVVYDQEYNRKQAIPRYYRTQPFYGLHRYKLPKITNKSADFFRNVHQSDRRFGYEQHLRRFDRNQPPLIHQNYLRHRIRLQNIPPFVFNRVSFSFCSCPLPPSLPASRQFYESQYTSFLNTFQRPCSYELPPLPPGAIIISDEYIDRDEQFNRIRIHKKKRKKRHHSTNNSSSSSSISFHKPIQQIRNPSLRILADQIKKSTIIDKTFDLNHVRLDQ